MKFFAVVLLFCSVHASDPYIGPDRPDEGAEESDAYLNPIGILHKYRYPGEEHRVVTEDGYVITLHRIPHGRAMSTNATKGPVILQHGLFSSSAHWIISGTKRGLGYILADSGYDVWMPNSRGNSFSLEHTKYSLKNPEYWNFSFHEMGVYDLPATFDYVLNQTGAEDVTYIGHSQGTTAFLVFNILRPEYNSKIRAAFLLAPIAYLGHSKSILLQVLSRTYEPIKIISNSLGIYSVFENNGPLDKIMEMVCTFVEPLNPIICLNALFLFNGFDNAEWNITLTSILLEEGIYGASLKQLIHYAQLVDSNKFRQYNYHLENLPIYGSPTPPDYDLRKAEARIHLYYSKNDWLGDVYDVKRLKRELSNVKESYMVKYDKFNHLDHLFAIDIIDLEYNHLLECIDSYYR